MNLENDEMTLRVRDCCPECGSVHYKKNGHIHNGKQNYRCNTCGRSFVACPENVVISLAQRDLIKKLLLERIPLRGISRVVGVSLRWLLNFITQVYEEAPDHLNVDLRFFGKAIEIQLLESEVDELWSFVGRKANKQWVWLALDKQTRQIIAFHVGDRSKDSAKKLWEKIPKIYREYTTFYTDEYASYEGVIPASQHRPVPKGTGQTNYIERFNCTLRQRVSRLVRKALSFSKHLQNHIGAIKYFICHYNLTKTQTA